MTQPLHNRETDLSQECETRRQIEAQYGILISQHQTAIVKHQTLHSAYVQIETSHFRNRMFAQQAHEDEKRYRHQTQKIHMQLLESNNALATALHLTSVNQSMLSEEQ